MIANPAILMLSISTSLCLCLVHNRPGMEGTSFGGFPSEEGEGRPGGVIDARAHDDIRTEQDRTSRRRRKFHSPKSASEEFAPLHFGMLSRNETIVRDRGESVELACEFNLEYYHAFDNPVIWLKSQLAEAKIKINSMAVVEQPFLESKRFSVAWHKQPPRYWFTLAIKGLKVEDTGNYTCEIRGKKSSVIMDVVKTLIVRDHIRIVQLILSSQRDWQTSRYENQRPRSKFRPVSGVADEDDDDDDDYNDDYRRYDVGRSFDRKERPTVVVTSLNQETGQPLARQYLFGDRSSITDGDQYVEYDVEKRQNGDGVSNATSARFGSSPAKGRESLTKVVLDSGDSSSFECLVVGGHPQPIPEILLGHRNLTSAFESHSRVRLVGTRGFKRIDLETSLRPRGVLSLTHKDHDKDFVCKARATRSSTTLAARLRLQINHRPEVACTPTSARLDDVNVCLRCDVIGRPAPAIFWTLDEHPVSMESRSNGYWSLVRDKGDGMFETSLCIGRAVADVFRGYDLVAENGFGRSTGRIDLIMNATRRSKDVFSNSFGEVGKQSPHQQMRVSSFDSERTAGLNSSSLSWLDHSIRGGSSGRMRTESALLTALGIVVRRSYH